MVIPQARQQGVKAVYVHPFDQEEMREGHSTMVGEIVEQLQQQAHANPDVTVCSVGGGGLLAGVVHGLDRYNLGHTTKVLAMKTKDADSLAQAIEDGSW